MLEIPPCSVQISSELPPQSIREEPLGLKQASDCEDQDDANEIDAHGQVAATAFRVHFWGDKRHFVACTSAEFKSTCSRLDLASLCRGGRHNLFFRRLPHGASTESTC